MGRRKRMLSLTLAGSIIISSGCGFGNSSNAEKWQTISVNGANKTSAEASPMKTGSFKSNLPAEFEMPQDEVGQKLLREYGAVFVARGNTTTPKQVIFKDSAAVSSWQSGVSVMKERVGYIEIELQTPAMKALQEAVAEAGQNNLTLTPRGADAARRSYEDTEELWASRVNPGLEYWTGKGKISQEEAARIKDLSPFEQVKEIFKLESEGIYFSKDLSKSITYSVAPPGTSQHLSMLALDVNENDNPKVLELLARHGWFQTVVSDLPHFTYLGVEEKELPGLGLKKITLSGRVFWVPADRDSL